MTNNTNSHHAVKTQPLTVNGQTFKVFYNDPKVWVNGMYLDDGVLVVNGQSRSLEEFDVSDLRDEDQVSIETGYFALPQGGLPKEHLLPGVGDGQFQDLFAAWVKAGEMEKAVREVEASRLKQVHAMDTTDMLEEMVRMEMADTGDVLRVDRVFFNELRRRMEGQLVYLAYSSECAAATIELMPRSWSGSQKKRFISLAQNALDALRDRFNPRSRVPTGRGIPVAIERLVKGIEEASKSLEKGGSK